jgi:hypothetical protein
MPRWLRRNAPLGERIDKPAAARHVTAYKDSGRLSIVRAAAADPATRFKAIE